jgi:hypothetical protein
MVTGKAKHPQSAPSGAMLTLSEEIQLEGIPPQSTLSATGGEQRLGEPFDEDEDEDEDESDVDEDEDGADKADDSVSALIRELQSSISLSRSGSGAGSLTESTKYKALDHVKRTDSNTSRKSQTGQGSSRASEHVTYEVSADPGYPEEPIHANSTRDQSGSFQNGHELQQLETTQFEWTFTETEQSTYERIFGLWERPAEECVSCTYPQHRITSFQFSGHGSFLYKTTHDRVPLFDYSRYRRKGLYDSWPHKP